MSKPIISTDGKALQVSSYTPPQILACTALCWQAPLLQPGDKLQLLTATYDIRPQDGFHASIEASLNKLIVAFYRGFGAISNSRNDQLMM